MADVNVRLLGRFEVCVANRVVHGFESRKVRVLLAYLALGDDRLEPSRARVAGLLWPDQPEAAGRRNLRQALYNIRETFAAAGVTRGSVLASGSGALALSPDLDVEVDVVEFEKLMAQGLNSRGKPAPGPLARALPLYRGDFLDGLYLEEGLAFEEWLLLRRERLRDLAIEGARTLVDLHRERREYGQAVATARRWLELDPLSEEGHRALMELYARSGRRSRALAQYESCVTLLRVELGLEPLPETKELLETILAEEAAELGSTQPAADSWPAPPLVGRREEYALLRESWQKVGPDGGRLVVVTGEAGVGKTRLVKTFVHGVAVEDGARVLLGRSFYTGCLPITLGTITDLFTSARAGKPKSLDALLDGHPVLKDYVTALLDEGFSPDGLRTSREEGQGRAGPGMALAALVRGWAEVCSHGDESGCRLILLLENLQWADESSLQAIHELLGQLSETPVWLVGTLDPTDGILTPEALADAAVSSRLDVVRLGRVEGSALRPMAAGLVGENDADELDAYITTASGGLPMAAAELVNLLFDEGGLTSANGGWRLEADLAEQLEDALPSLDEVLARRVAALHGSSRRVAIAASVMGHTFDVATLAAVVDEPMAVMEPVLQDLLERGFVRFLPPYWYESRRERDLVLWGQGARRGIFQLGSQKLADALLRSIPDERQRLIHRRVADVLERARPGQRATGHAEDLAGHLLAAGEEARALPWLMRTCERALFLGALASAATAARIGLDLCEPGTGDAERWHAAFQDVLAAAGDDHSS